MPEGDTIHKVGQVVRELVLGKVLTGVMVRGVYGAEKLAGTRVAAVEVLGKHMIVHLGSDHQLRVHLGMKGSWHRYPLGAKWKRPRSTAAVILQTEQTDLVCFEALDVELFPTAQRKWHRQLAGLGPDLLGPEEPNWSMIVRRAYRLHNGQALLGEVLLDQRVAAGIGNVYKSELAFMGPLKEDAFTLCATGFSPWLALQEVPREDLQGLFARARVLLQANLGGWLRTTRVDRRVKPAPKGGGVYVYGRAQESCYRCACVIKRGFQGLQNRVTYWCPECQKS